MAEASADDTGQKSFLFTSPKFDFHDPKNFHDRVLLVENQKFYVQSGLLMTWSEYFKGLFGSNFKEANEKEIEVKDVSAEDFNNFLMLTYPTKFELNENNYAGLINLAHRFLAPRVMELCQEFWLANFEKLDKITLLELAFKNEMVELKDMLAHFIAAGGRKENGFLCNVCHFFIGRKPYCIHLSKDGYRTNFVNEWIFNNIDRISELPLEIQGFILRSSVLKY